MGGICHRITLKNLFDCILFLLLIIIIIALTISDTEGRIVP